MFLVTHALPKLVSSYVSSAFGIGGHINNAPAITSLALKILGLLADGFSMLNQHRMARRKFVSAEYRLKLDMFNRLYTSQGEFEQEKKRLETDYEKSLLPLFNTMADTQKELNVLAKTSNSVRKPLIQRLEEFEEQVSEVNRIFREKFSYNQGQLDVINSQICQLLGIPDPNDPLFKNPLLRGLVILGRDTELIDGG